MAGNRLFYGDNLDVLRQHVPDESVDLIYLDPPFNSNRNYNVLFSKSGYSDTAQIQAFDDTWRWTPETERQYHGLLAGKVPGRVADALTAMRTLIGENDMLAYLVNMAPRLTDMRRVLKPTGSLYLHCDTTASAYLKILLDAIFGPMNFRNEIVWKRFNFHADANRFGRVTDRILFYTRSDAFTFNAARVPFSEEYVRGKFRYDDEDGRGPYRLSDLNPPAGRGPIYDFHGVTKPWRLTEEKMRALDDDGRIYTASQVAQLKRFLNELAGQSVHELWTDVAPINPRAAERLGYPTQKPVALLERIIAASSNANDVVLDPFCGCGTTIDAAIRLSRRWMGIDITYLAVDLIEKRLRHTFGDSITSTYEVHGIPSDLGGAQALFDRSPFDFERWAVSLVNGTPNQKQVGDKGVDGVIRFLTDGKGGTGRGLVSVKGGKTVGPTAARDLGGTVQTQKAEMGILVTMGSPTRGVIDEANHAGTYTWPINGQTFPRIQVVSVPDLLAGRKPTMPAALMPYIAAARRAPVVDQPTLGDG